MIRVDGKRLPPVSPNVYLVLNKPRGVVSTMSDPEGRRTLSDLVADRPERLFHVGRLDTDTSGLLLLTNDGDFAQRMAHPSYEVDKTYVAEVDGEVSRATLQTLLAGVTLEDGPVSVSQVRVVSGAHGKNAPGKTIVELVIHEGRNRIVRRLLDHVGHPVRRLTRTAIGPVQLGPARVRRAARAHAAASSASCWTAPSSAPRAPSVPFRPHATMERPAPIYVGGTGGPRWAAGEASYAGSWARWWCQGQSRTPSFRSVLPPRLQGCR